MSGLLESVHLVDAVLAILALEGIALGTWWKLHRRGIPPDQLLPNLIAGACLLMALRVTLAGASWPWFAGFLALAGMANVVDLRRRWRD